MCTLIVLFSCKDESKNILQEEDINPLIFKSTTVSGLESEVTSMISVTFSCGSFIFDDCLDAAQKAYKAHQNGEKVLYADKVLVALNDNIQSKNTLSLRYDNLYKRTVKTIQDHNKRWSPSPLPPPLNNQKVTLQENFRDETAIILNCDDVSFNQCQRAIQKLTKLYNNSNLSNALRYVVMENSPQTLEFNGATLLLGLRASSRDISAIIDSHQRPVQPPLDTPLQKTVRKLRSISGIRMSCLDSISERACLDVAKKTLRVFKEDLVSPGRIHRIQVVRANDSLSSTREVLEIPSNATKKIISHLVRAHNRKF